MEGNDAAARRGGGAVQHAVRHWREPEPAGLPARHCPCRLLGCERPGAQQRVRIRSLSCHRRIITADALWQLSRDKTCGVGFALLKQSDWKPTAVRMGTNAV